MKTLAHIAKTTLAAIALAATFTACNSGNSADPKTATAGDSTAAAIPSTLNIRYIDGDSVSANYNLAKDFKEQYLRSLTSLQNAEASKKKEIQNFGSSIENKMRSNGYLSEDSYNADMMRLNKMQQDAASYLESLQRNTEQELVRQQQELNDSIEAFIKDYNAKKGYDAILYKAAGVYFNPALDITNEVIEGLNARYNKVKPSK